MTEAVTAEDASASVPVPIPEAAASATSAPAPAPVAAQVPGGRTYETLVIFPARYEGESLEAQNQEIRKLIESHGGAIGSVDVMGKRTLAYKIRKQTEGVYVNFVYSALPSALDQLEKDLHHQETIVRFLTTTEAR
jgi:small subunit ribosomal protein S6